MFPSLFPLSELSALVNLPGGWDDEPQQHLAQLQFWHLGAHKDHPTQLNPSPPT